jgi:hypothetical protein
MDESGENEKDSSASPTVRRTDVFLSSLRF